MYELVERTIRSKVLESGKGRFVEGSIKMHERNWRDRPHMTYYVRYLVTCCDGRRLWYGAEFSANGNLISRLFN